MRSTVRPLRRGCAVQRTRLPTMKIPIRSPEQILAHRNLKEIVGAWSDIWSVKSSDTIATALELMIDKDVGFLLVLEADALVGVLSERDCARRVLAVGKLANDTRVADVMVRNVVTVEL